MTHLDFIAAYLETRTQGIQAVARRTKFDTHTIHCLVSDLRQRGCRLPPLARYRRSQPLLSDRLDVDAINKFLSER